MGLKDRIENKLEVFFVGTLITGFLAGIGAYQGILKIAKLEVVGQQRLGDFEMLKTKDRFLSLYLRYALNHLPPFAFEVSDQDRENSRKDLDDYMMTYISVADKSESLVAIGKGQGTQTTIIFPDGSIWKVPPGFRAAEAD